MTPGGPAALPGAAGRGLVAAASVLTLSLWVAVCAAAPEFIWRGARIAAGHLGLADLYSALLIGAILTFFVEPAMERVRCAMHRQPAHQHRPVLFTALVGLAFALVAVCLHDALLAYVSAGEGGHAGEHNAGLRQAIDLTVSWAAVPFCTTLAWLCVRPRWIAVPTAAAACVSTYAAGRAFAWTGQEIVTTAIPCLAILGIGYRRIGGAPGAGVLRRCAWVVGGVAAAWLIAAAATDAALAASGSTGWRLYPAPGYWMDVRFYLGWLAGLLVAPAAL